MDPDVSGAAPRSEVVRVIVAGWFSFEDGHATAGDLLARDLVCEWLASMGYAHDVAVAPPFRGGIALAVADPRAYSHAVFVCGPFERKALEAQFLGRFAHCRVIGVNLTMTTPAGAWNPFDALIERDSAVGARPDVVFASSQGPVPVLGRCLVESYEGARVADADAAIQRLCASRELAVVDIDTRLDVNATGLRTPAEIESLLARMDLVVTTRLHGMVFALKNGVPAIAIDPEPGGGKIARQAAIIGWPFAFVIDAVTAGELEQALDACLRAEARAKAKDCGERALPEVEATRVAFLAALLDSEPAEASAGKRSERAAFAATFTGGVRSGATPAGDGLLRALTRRVTRLARGLRREDAPAVTDRIAVFHFHRAIDLCRARLRLLRTLNPGVRVFGIFAGEPADWRAASGLVDDGLEAVYRFEGRDARWKWQNTDLVVRAWHAAVGRTLRFDVAHVVQWDLVLFEPLDRLYAHVGPGAVALTGLTRLDAIADRWPWTVDPVLRADEERLHAIARAAFGYRGTRHACLGPGYCLPRTFLDRYAAADVPEHGHDETRLPLFAEIFGFPLADTGFYPAWFDDRHDTLFNAVGVEIAPGAVAAELRRPDGRRAFHPCREAFAAGELERLLSAPRP